MGMIKKLLSQSSYWVINKDLASKLGFEPTLLLTHLIDCADMLEQPFYQQRSRILETLGWSEKTYRSSVKTLKDKNIISSEVKGIPPKNYWTVNEREIHALIETNPSDISVKMTLPYQRQNDATKKRNIKKEINNNIGEVEGGTSLGEMSPTSSTPQSKKKSGWEKLVEIYPPTKHRDIIEASIYWDTLTQEEKQMIFRHVNPYINNTPTQMLKQIGKYLQSDLWRNMKPPTNKEVSQYKNTGFVDYNFIEWYNTFYEIGSWEVANKDFQTLDNETKKIIKTEYERIKRNQKQGVE